MTSLIDLAEDASKSSVPTQELLRRLKIVAAQIRLPTLAGWVQKELSGYSSDDDIPKYRGPFDGEVRGNFYGSFGASATNHVIPRSAFKEEFQEGLFTVQFVQSIAELEQLAKAPSDHLSSPWSGDHVAAIDRCLKPGIQLMPGYVCHDARRTVSSAQLVGIIDAVRDRILDLVLGLVQISPDHNVSDAPVSAEVGVRATNVVQNVIYGENISIAGNLFSQSIINAAPSNMEELFDRLLGFGLNNDDLQGLKSAIAKDKQADQSSTGAVGSRVSKWLKDTAGKTASQSVAAAISQIVTAFVLSAMHR